MPVSVEMVFSTINLKDKNNANEGFTYETFDQNHSTDTEEGLLRGRPISCRRMLLNSFDIVFGITVFILKLFITLMAFGLIFGFLFITTNLSASFAMKTLTKFGLHSHKDIDNPNCLLRMFIVFCLTVFQVSILHKVGLDRLSLYFLPRNKPIVSDLDTKTYIQRKKDFVTNQIVTNNEIDEKIKKAKDTDFIIEEIQCFSIVVRKRVSAFRFEGKTTRKYTYSIKVMPEYEFLTANEQSKYEMDPKSSVVVTLVERPVQTVALDP